MVMNTKILFPTDPMAYTGYKHPSNLFPDCFVQRKKYRRDSWDENKFVFLNGLEVCWFDSKMKYTPTEPDVEASDWVVSEMTDQECNSLLDTMITVMVNEEA